MPLRRNRNLSRVKMNFDAFFLLYYYFEVEGDVEIYRKKNSAIK